MVEICGIVCLILIVPYPLLVMGSFFYFKFGWFAKLYHNVLGWHTPTSERTYQHGRACSACSRCGKEIEKDSLGFWLLISRE